MRIDSSKNMGAVHHVATVAVRRQSGHLKTAAISTGLKQRYLFVRNFGAQPERTSEHASGRPRTAAPQRGREPRQRGGSVLTSARVATTRARRRTASLPAAATRFVCQSNPRHDQDHWNWYGSEARLHRSANCGDHEGCTSHNGANTQARAALSQTTCALLTVLIVAISWACPRRTLAPLPRHRTAPIEVDPEVRVAKRRPNGT